MGKLYLSNKTTTEPVKRSISPVATSSNVEVSSSLPPQQIVVKEIIERPIEVIKEVIVEVPVIKEVIVERREEIPVIKEVIKEVVKVVEVPVEVVKVEVKEVEKVVKIPVIKEVMHTPAWVKSLVTLIILKYAGLAIWLAVK